MALSVEPFDARFARVVRSSPAAPALRWLDSTLSYHELNERVERCAFALRSNGVTAGSRVGLSAGNSVEFVAVMLAALRIGAPLIMISTSWREQEVSHAVALTSPDFIVHDGSATIPLGPFVGSGHLLHIDQIGEVDAVTHDGLADGPSLDDLAVMVFSSGTTGLPKAVRHSHRTLASAIDHWTESLGLTSNDRLQIATPPFHILGLLNVLVVCAAGASVRLHRRFELDILLQSIERDRVTIEMAVAPIALAIAAHPHLETFDLSSLRYIMWGATPVTPVVAETITRRCGVRILPAYGASELPVLTCNPVDRPEQWRLDSVGLPPSGVELRIADLETGDVLPRGATGEIQARAKSMMLGYLPDDANADAITDGWYRTGDVGRLDADGWLTITDRVKEMIKVNGFQVAPAEIEATLLTHANVIDCAAFGVPDSRTGEAIIAAVVLADPHATAQPELQTLVAERLASYKQIREIVICTQIPRLPSGKVLRRHLRSEYLAI